jgi:hypothetical protein
MNSKSAGHALDLAGRQFRTGLTGAIEREHNNGRGVRAERDVGFDALHPRALLPAVQVARGSRSRSETITTWMSLAASTILCAGSRDRAGSIDGRPGRVM